MTDAGVRARPAWPPAAVTLLTFLWVAGLLLALYQLFAVGMEQWADRSGGAEVGGAALDRRSDRWGSIFLAVLAGGPVVTAVVAAVGGLRKTAIGYGVLAVPLIGFALVVASNLHRDEPAPPPAPPGHCVEHSGGDTRCPGG
jgi:hypothetical protein